MPRIIECSREDYTATVEKFLDEHTAQKAVLRKDAPDKEVPFLILLLLRQHETVSMALAKKKRLAPVLVVRPHEIPLIKKALLAIARHFQDERLEERASRMSFACCETNFAELHRAAEQVHRGTDPLLRHAVRNLVYAYSLRKGQMHPANMLVIETGRGYAKPAPERSRIADDFLEVYHYLCADDRSGYVFTPVPSSSAQQTARRPRSRGRGLLGKLFGEACQHLRA